MLLDRLTRSALDHVHRAGDGRAIDAGELRTNAGIFAAVSPSRRRCSPRSARRCCGRAFAMIAAPWGVEALAANMFSIQVSPGNATIAKGGDELIEARLRGFQSEQVELLVRRADSASWTRPHDRSRQQRALRLPTVRRRREDRIHGRGEWRGVRRRVTLRRLEPAVREGDEPPVSLSGVHAARATRPSTAPATSRRSRAQWCAFASRPQCPPRAGA